MWLEETLQKTPLPLLVAIRKQKIIIARDGCQKNYSKSSSNKLIGQVDTEGIHDAVVTGMRTEIIVYFT